MRGDGGREICWGGFETQFAPPLVAPLCRGILFPIKKFKLSKKGKSLQIDSPLPPCSIIMRFLFTWIHVQSCMNCNLISAVLFFAKLLECAMRTCILQWQKWLLMKMRVCVLPEDKEVQSRLENGPYIDLGIFFCAIKKNCFTFRS